MVVAWSSTIVASESLTHPLWNHLTNLNLYWQNYTAGCGCDSRQRGFTGRVPWLYSCNVGLEGGVLWPPQQRMPIPIAMKVPNVPPLCIMVFPTPPISSLPRMPILQNVEAIVCSLQTVYSLLCNAVTLTLSRLYQIIYSEARYKSPTHQCIFIEILITQH